MNALVGAVVTDWNPLVAAGAFAILMIAPAVVAYLQGRTTQQQVGEVKELASSNQQEVGKVKTLVNGGQADLAARVAAIERALITGAVTVVHSDERRQTDTPTIVEAPSSTP